MYNHMDSNMSYFSALFFIMLVIVGSFFVLNLVLAVIMDANASYDSDGAIDLEAMLKLKELDLAGGDSSDSDNSDEDFIA